MTGTSKRRGTALDELNGHVEAATAEFDHDNRYLRVVDLDHGLDRERDDAYELDLDLWPGEHRAGT